MVLSGGIRAGLLVMVVALSACGSPSPSRTASPTPTATPTPRPSAATGACASVTTTTPIEQVPAACAALWAPYGVTKVPPANLTDSTPVPPTVINGTNGAVSDADARALALAANTTGVWLRWSEANSQYQLTRHIESAQVVNASIEQLLRQGTKVVDPDCDLFADKYEVFAMSPEGSAFFQSFGQATDHDAVVLVEYYPGPCAIEEQPSGGSLRTLVATPSAVVSVATGSVHHDPVLGAIWFADGAAFCSSRGAPNAWCNR